MKSTASLFSSSIFNSSAKSKALSSAVNKGLSKSIFVLTKFDLPLVGLILGGNRSQGHVNIPTIFADRPNKSLYPRKGKGSFTALVTGRFARPHILRFLLRLLNVAVWQ